MALRIKVGVLSFFTAFIFSFSLSDYSLAHTVATPQQYIEYLVNKGEIDPDFTRTKDQFEKLPLQKQKRFVEYINDPTVLECLFQNMEPNTHKKLYGGDVAIQDTTTTICEDGPENKVNSTFMNTFCSLLFRPVFAANTTKDLTATHVKTASIFGLTLSAFTVNVKYRVKGSKVVKIISGNATCSNCYPVDIQLASLEKYIHNNKAHTAAEWQISSILEKVKLGFVKYHYHHEVHGYPNGKVTNSWWKH